MEVLPGPVLGPEPFGPAMQRERPSNGPRPVPCAVRDRTWARAVPPLNGLRGNVGRSAEGRRGATQRIRAIGFVTQTGHGGSCVPK